MKRSAGRELAFSFLYKNRYEDSGQFEVDSELELLFNSFSDLASFSNPDSIGFAKEIIKGVMEKRSDLQAKIESILLDCRWENINYLEQIILLIGAYELLYTVDVPKKVVINEAINMAKRFAGTDSFAFINRILDTIDQGQKHED